MAWKKRTRTLYFIVMFLADYKIYNLTIKYGILVCCYATIIVKFKF